MGTKTVGGTRRERGREREEGCRFRFGFVLRWRKLRKVASLLLTNDVYIYIYIIGYYYPSLQRVLFYLSTPPYHFYKTNPVLFRLFTIPYSAVTPSAYPMLSPFSFLFFFFLFFFYWKTKIVDPNPSNFVTKTILLCHCLVIFRRFRV